MQILERVLSARTLCEVKSSGRPLRRARRLRAIVRGLRERWFPGERLAPAVLPRTIDTLVQNRGAIVFIKGSCWGLGNSVHLCGVRAHECTNIYQTLSVYLI